MLNVSLSFIEREENVSTPGAVWKLLPCTYNVLRLNDSERLKNEVLLGLFFCSQLNKKSNAEGFLNIFQGIEQRLFILQVGRESLTFITSFMHKKG